VLAEPLPASLEARGDFLDEDAGMVVLVVELWDFEELRRGVAVAVR